MRNTLFSLFSFAAVPFLLASRAPAPRSPSHGHVAFPFVPAAASLPHDRLTTPLYQRMMPRTFNIYLSGSGLSSLVTTAGTYQYLACVRDNDNNIHSDVNLEMFRGSTRTVLSYWDTYNLATDDCIPEYDMPINWTTPDFQLKARNCYFNGSYCIDYDSLYVAVRVPVATISGPSHVKYGQMCTYTATLVTSPAPATPLSYVHWYTDDAGLGDGSLTITVNTAWLDGFIDILVVDANGKGGSAHADVTIDSSAPDCT